MNDLIDFYSSRLNEAETRILNGWDSDGRSQVACMWVGDEPGYTTVASGRDGESWFADGREVVDPRHVQVLWDPQVELADIAAKRAVLAQCEAAVAARAVDAVEVLTLTMTCLVQPFAGHPEFRPEWAA